MSRLIAPASAHDVFFALPTARRRHLVWSLLSPSLLECEWSPAQPEWLPELADLLACPEPDQARSPRLGLVFEHLWQHWLKHSGYPWQANVQIQSQHRTLGELDLLLQPPASSALHIELALKFYAGLGNDWIGPNRKDFLADKLEHTRTRQLPLAQTDTARQHLQQLGWHQLHSQAVFRGCLLYPAHPELNARAPEAVSSNHWRGLWCHYQDTETLLPEAHWYLLAKDEWISPTLSQIAIPTAELQPLLDLHFRYLRVPVCLGRMESGAHGWGEIERWFVMPNQWPVQTVSAPSL